MVCRPDTCTTEHVSSRRTPSALPPTLIPNHLITLPLAGEFVARYVAASANGEGISWAVAGRSQAKLDKVVAGLAGWPNTASALLTQPKDVIIADVVSMTLADMTSPANVWMTTWL